MITDRVITILGWRLFLLNLSRCAPCNWAWKRNRLKPSGFYSHCNWWLILFGALAYSSVMALRIYSNQRVVFGKGYEDERVYLMSKSGKRISASLIYLTIDSLAISFMMNLLGLAILISNKRYEICLIVNGILDLDNQLKKDLSRQIPALEDPHRRQKNHTEFFAFLVSTGSMLMPILYGVTIFYHYEPVHRTLTDLFEVAPKPELKILPAIFVVDYGLLFCSNAAIILIIVGLIYIGLCNFWIPGIILNAVVYYEGRPLYSTKVGLLDEAFIVKVYRCQQVANVAINEVLKSKWTSMHHGTILFIFVMSTYLCVHYTEDVREMGLAGMVVPATAIVTVVLEYFETHLIGKILWESRRLKRVGVRVSRKGSTLNKFFKSCTDIKMRTAYPFFVVSYDTFLLLVNLVTLLVFSN